MDVHETRTHSAAPGRFTHELRMSSPGIIHPKLWRKIPANVRFGGLSTRRRTFGMEHRPGAGLCQNDRYAPFDFNGARGAGRQVGSHVADGDTVPKQAQEQRR